MTNYDHLCLGCMGDKGAESVCPHCGWVAGSPAEAPQHCPQGRFCMINIFLEEC